MYAVMETGNVQHRVEEGDTLCVARFDAKAGDKVTFDKVLLTNDGQNTKIGTPYVEGATVSAEVLGETLGDKVEIFKMKRRATYRLHRGHRQKYTEIRIEKISISG